MRRAFVVAGLLTCAFFAFAQDPVTLPAGTDVRATAARAALRRAVHALEAGDAEGALEASDEARSLDGTDADVRYVRALSALRAGRPLPEAEAELRVALAGGAFLSYSADDAARLLAHVLLQTKRYSEALPLLNRPSLDADSDTLYLRARALRFLGDAEGFLAAVDDGLDRFPSDARIVRELLAFASQVPRTEAVASRVRRVEGRLGYYRYLDPELLLLLVPFRSAQVERRDLLLEYRALGKKNPSSVPLAVELGILDDAAAAAEFFSFPTLSWTDYRRLRDLARDDAGRLAFASAFSLYAGTIGHDSNGDGIPETRTAYSRGDIEEWTLDFDQDGLNEAAFRFRENLPESGTMVLEGGRVYLEYGTYPYLSRVLYSASSSVREYLFAPDVLAFPVVELSVETVGRDGKGYSVQRTRQAPPNETACASFAYRVVERPASSAPPALVTDMNRGTPVRSLVRTADGRSGIVVYRGGRPSYERADMDGDGLYESRYVYDTDARSAESSGKAPEPTRFEGDFDLDGQFEYREGLSFPFERTWDYDGDGRVDARTTALKEGGELWEFSRRFDGRLDTALVVRDGRMVHVLRGGTETPLVQDSGGKVLWVGHKPFDFGRVLPETGPGRRGTVRYRVVRFGDQYIAEALE